MATSTRSTKKPNKSRSAAKPKKLPTFFGMRLGKPAIFVIVFALVGIGTLLYSLAAVPTGQIKLKANGKCLENFYNRQLDGNFISTYPCQTTNKAQQWSVYSTDKSIRTAENYCLDVQKGGKAPLTKVHLWRCTGGVPQKWDILSSGQLRNPNSMLCLEADSKDTFLGGPSMYVNTCNASNTRQIWTVPTGTILAPLVPAPTNPVPAPAPAPTPGVTPAAQSIIDSAGPKGSTATSKGSFTITASGTYTNFNATKLYVKANNVTVRNCRVVGSGSYPVQLVNGYSNLTIENCHLQNTGGSATVTETGTNVTIRRSVVIGYNGDAIKASRGGLYEYNVIKSSKASGSSAHSDGIQSQAVSGWKARYNYIDTPAQSGGNIGLFQQAWNGSLGKCLNITGVEWTGNYLRGGNYGIGVEGYKRGGCAPGKYISGMRITGNRLADGALDGTIWRHKYCSLDSANVANYVVSDNKFVSGKVAPGCNL